MQLFSIEVIKSEIKRDYYLNKLITKKHNGLIKVITGMRRCGKSYLLFTLFKQHLHSCGVAEDHIIEIAFDSFESKKFRDPEVLYPYIKARIADDQMYYILLDEVQMLGEFESVLNGLMRISNVDVGLVCVSGKDGAGKAVRKQLEVDFVCNKGSKRYYVQSAFAIPDEAKMQQESNSLLRIDDAFKKIIVVKDTPAPWYTDDGILVISVYDFLLNEDSLDM
ncbi:MAG: AAA family ATPase [Firmicutes bacterium]|nr:AAA family ATPase [Bacillota bacterium]